MLQITSIPCIHLLAHAKDIGVQPEYLLEHFETVAAWMEQAEVLATAMRADQTDEGPQLPWPRELADLKLCPVGLPRAGRPSNKTRHESRQEIMTVAAKDKATHKRKHAATLI